jgi:hypothetical protein
MLAMGGQNNNPILGMVKTLLTPLLVLLIKTFALVFSFDASSRTTPIALRAVGYNSTVGKTG